MIQKLDKVNNIENFYTGFLMHAVRFDKANYEQYKVGSLENASEDTLLKMEVLSVLEKLTFPMDEAGTYFFKDMIIRTMRYLDKADCHGHAIGEEQILRQLQKPYSQFYIDLARNERDIGLKTFHSYIETALRYVDYRKADPETLTEVYSDFSKEASYGEHAFVIAKAMVNSKKKDEVNQYVLIDSSSVQVND